MTTIPLPVLPAQAKRAPSSVVAELLEKQRDLTAVEQFARTYTPGRAAEVTQARFYRDLIPLGLPGKGKQYAFEVDLDSCTGCKACVTACHGLNGLDETEAWRSVGLLVGGSVALPVMQHVTGACHHCVAPACLDGCPVLAYEKDPLTGIVHHLDDQCIGCQYCVLKCPYDVPKYNARLGIVRKCDMCSDRLATGEAPACVQACPTQAIRIKVVDQAEAVAAAETKLHLVGLPDPQYTVPTTEYKSGKSLPRNTLPADYQTLMPQKAHWSLIFMLVLMQASVGSFAVMDVMSRALGADAVAGFRRVHALAALGVGLVAMMASVFHLGRPLYAFRAFLGYRKSWLSREVMAFGLFMAVASVRTAGYFGGGLSWLDPWVAPLGALVVLCSIMVYHDTRREFWNARYSAVRFVFGAAALGLAVTLGVALAARDSAVLDKWGPELAEGLACIVVVKLVFESTILLHLTGRHLTPMRRTAMLLVGPLMNATTLRLGLGLLGGVLLPLMLAMGGMGSHPSTMEFGVVAGVAFASLLAGELVERYLFFRAVVAPKMPGGMGT